MAPQGGVEPSAISYGKSRKLQSTIMAIEINGTYAAYSYERAGILTGTRYFRGKDWYKGFAKRFPKGHH